MYGGFYTRQEQEDALAARLENPNRVGTGFINFGAMERQPQAAANWQTGGLIGGAASTPSQVSDIWNSTPAPPPAVPPPQPRLAPQPQQISVQPQLPPQPFAAPAPGPSAVASTCALFQSLGIDSAPSIRKEPVFPGVGGGGVAGPYSGLNEVPGLSTAAAKPPPPPQPPAQSLMNLLQPTPPPQPPPQLNAAFAPMCNGGVPPAPCGSRAQAAFSNPIAAAPQCQLPSNGVHSAAFPSCYIAPPVPHQPPPRPAPSTAPRPLSSAADYAVAAANYKPPVAPRAAQSAASVSRKPEATKPQAHHPVQKEEWECPRCTFLNDSAIRECEMCGFERPGAEHEPPPARSEDDGWRTASSAARKNAPVPSAAQAGKSKAQAKNEKRRAKKRGDGA